MLACALAMTGCASLPQSTPVPGPGPDSGPDPGDDVFEVLRRQALEDSQTPEARAYERDFYPAIGEDLADLLKKCTTEFPAPEIDSFELVFRIDHWGEPKAILVDPLTDLSQCVARGFWYFKFPQPAGRFGETGLVLLLPVSIR